jgi:hypothetical protein
MSILKVQKAMELTGKVQNMRYEYLENVPSFNLILLVIKTDATEARYIQHSKVWDTSMGNLKENLTQA